MQKISTLIAIAFISLTGLQAQEGWEAGVWGGVANYFGDLNTNYNMDLIAPAGGVQARYNFNERICLKFSANATEISAHDSVSQNVVERMRNLGFTSEVIDASVGLEFNFLPYIHGSQHEYFTPYLFGGFSAFYFDPKAEYQGQEYSLRELGTEGQFKGEEYYTVTGALNYGIGMKVDLNYRISLNVELGMRSTFTDYLDDVSTVYADKRDLLQTRGPVAVALSDPSVNQEFGKKGDQRGDDSNNDSYGFLGLSVMYYFGELKCPDVSRIR